MARDELIASLAAQAFPVGAVLSKPVTLVGLVEACALAWGDAQPTSSEDSVLAVQQETFLRLRGARVLLVEDNEINQELALELLSDAGIVVQIAVNGEQALMLLEQHPFDLILMDCQMPVMDGYEATRALRRDSRWRTLPVIAMTANAMLGDRERALEAGMNDHIPKPIDVVQLSETLERWLGAHI